MDNAERKFSFYAYATLLALLHHYNWLIMAVKLNTIVIARAKFNFMFRQY